MNERMRRAGAPFRPFRLVPLPRQSSAYLPIQHWIALLASTLLLLLVVLSSVEGIAFSHSLSTPTPMPSSDYQNKILFLSDRDGRKALYLMNPDGSNQLNVDRDPLAHYYYEETLKLETYSPDRQFIAFVRREKDDYQIWMQRLSDGYTWFVAGATEGADYSPAWSPDGAHIAWVSQQHLNDEIYVVDLQAEKPERTQRLTFNRFEWDKHPSWSPDGSQIVFWSNRDGLKQIWLMDANGKNQHNISRSSANDWDPVWVKHIIPPPTPTPTRTPRP